MCYSGKLAEVCSLFFTVIPMNLSITVRSLGGLLR